MAGTKAKASVGKDRLHPDGRNKDQGVNRKGSPSRCIEEAEFTRLF